MEFSEICKFVSGLVITFTANLLLVTNSYIMKANPVNACELMFLRGALQVVIFGFISYFFHFQVDFASKRWQQIVSSLAIGFGFALSTFLVFFAIKLMPVGDLVVVCLMTPAPTLIISKIMLKEVITPFKVILVLLLVIGVLLVVQPMFLFKQKLVNDIHETNSTSEDVPIIELYPSYYFGITLCLLACLLTSISSVMLVKTDMVSASTLTLYMGLGGLMLALLSPIFALPNRILNSSPGLTPWDWMVLFYLCSTSIAANFMIIVANRWTSPTITSTLRSFEIIMSLLIDLLFYNYVPNGFHLTGTTLVTFSVFLMPLSEQISRWEFQVIPQIKEKTKHKQTEDEKCEKEGII